MAETSLPCCKVTLYKTIARRIAAGSRPVAERYTGAKRTIDLTPYLGDGSAIVTGKDIRQPAGTWSLTLSDKMDPDQLESLYGLIEPMDVIEIRLGRHDLNSAGQVEPPLVMRGFVSHVRRNMGIAANGAPQRAVVISGHDYGKILQIIRIAYLPNFVVGQNLLTSLNFAVNYGVDAEGIQYSNDFVKGVVDKIINPYLQTLIDSSGQSDGSGAPVSDVRTMALSATAENATVATFGLQSWAGGSIYDMLKYFGDVGPWNELFVEDREDADGGVTLVYRSNPMYDLASRDLVVSAAVDPGITTIDDAEVVRLEVGRTDANVANYYMVNAPAYSLIAPEMVGLNGNTGAAPSYMLGDYPNSNVHLYGLRIMSADTRQGDYDMNTRGDGQSANVVQEDIAKLGSFVDRRRAQLMALNQDNVVFESGSIVAKGNPSIKAGRYLRIRLGGRAVSQNSAAASAYTWECYVTRVEHRFYPFQGFTTVVHYERGTGFAERIRLESGGAYLAELNQHGA